MTIAARFLQISYTGDGSPRRTTSGSALADRVQRHLRGVARLVAGGVVQVDGDGGVARQLVLEQGGVTVAVGVGGDEGVAHGDVAQHAAGIDVRAALDHALAAQVHAALEALKARDVREIDVRGKTGITDWMVIVSGTSTRHVKSIADEVMKFAKRIGNPPIGVEGEREAEWVLVDLGDVIVHVMLPRVREFYALERLWGDAERIEIKPQEAKA